jgi:hypothetical protein
MKNTAVRDFAASQAAKSAAEPAGRGSQADLASEASGAISREAEEGMAEMSKRFHDEVGELYVPATE